MSEQLANGMTPPDDQAANEVALPDPSASNTAAETQSLNVASPPRLGFLSLPREIRDMVYRELFHRPSPSEVWYRLLKPVPDFLATCKLTNREAFEILWGENPYIWENPPPPLLPGLLNRIVDTIQILHVTVRWGSFSAVFYDAVRRFGNPGKIRDNLEIRFVRDPRPLSYDLTYMDRFLVGLGRFTNFKTVRIVVAWRGKDLHISNRVSTRIAQAMCPRLGPSEPNADGNALVLHPRAHWKAQQPQETVDWMNLLDGIRLDWNLGGTSASCDADQNPDENADKSSGPAPSQK